MIFPDNRKIAKTLGISSQSVMDQLRNPTMPPTPNWKIVDRGCGEQIDDLTGVRWECTHHLKFNDEIFHAACDDDFPHQTLWFGIWIGGEDPIVYTPGYETPDGLFAKFMDAKVAHITDEDIAAAKEQAKRLLDGL